MKVMLVDDEPLALQFLETQLHNIGDFTIVGAYQTSRGLMDRIKEKKPELLFLDIKIGSVNGVELAATIQEEQPNLPIVFVTGFHEYAVQAFELNALDYIVKPIQKERLRKTIQRLNTEVQKKASDTPIRINCMPTLQFFQNGETLPVQWRTSKAKEVFCYLLHHAEKPVRKDVLIEEFWEEKEPEKAFTQLYSTIYVIRKTFSGSLPSLSLSSANQCYQLHLGDAEVDVMEWSNNLKQLPALSEHTLSSYQGLLREYKGDYFSAEAYIWAESEQRQLKESWYKTAIQVGLFLEAQNLVEDAISLYLRMQTDYPYISHSYIRLMHVYDMAGVSSQVVHQYERLMQMLEEEFDIGPEAELVDWYEMWREQHMQA
ncbi:Two-component response regulator, SAPR family, consists of REC, wHTH and BTAD domains [Terribacillus saccharophilus]|uniref:Two-component response regulator, SAPR family, consists of REC, wHTH and BTAD domains n=1 Tax=Terribacillus saccharophilus TaxID=361277 RepID=A0AAX2EFJ8_9BACI|nr:Two-component response regulator, SAPR family, consists of REC, wHTH and BTAD domains [Terribacillus saccharophilus]